MQIATLSAVMGDMETKTGGMMKLMTKTIEDRFVKLGRQELAYGDERLIGSLNLPYSVMDDFTARDALQRVKLN